MWGERRVFVVEAVRSLLERGGHDNLEIVVVYDTDTPDAVLEALRERRPGKLRLSEYDRPFDFSEKCNLGSCRPQANSSSCSTTTPELISAGLPPAARGRPCSRRASASRVPACCSLTAPSSTPGLAFYR